MSYILPLAVSGDQIPFETSDGLAWQMKQPTPAEEAGATAAFQLEYNRLLNDPMLKKDFEPEEIQRAALAGATKYRAVFIIPMLLLTVDGEQVFNVHNADSLAEYYSLDPKIINEFVNIYLGPIQDAIREAKKKHQSNFYFRFKVPSSSTNGRFQALSEGQQRPK